jgi:hypothetical protein
LFSSGGSLRKYVDCRELRIAGYRYPVSKWRQMSLEIKKGAMRARALPGIRHVLGKKQCRARFFRINVEE